MVAAPPLALPLGQIIITTSALRPCPSSLSPLQTLSFWTRSHRVPRLHPAAIPPPLPPADYQQAGSVKRWSQHRFIPARAITVPLRSTGDRLSIGGVGIPGKHTGRLDATRSLRVAERATANSDGRAASSPPCNIVATWPSTTAWAIRPAYALTPPQSPRTFQTGLERTSLCASVFLQHLRIALFV